MNGDREIDGAYGLFFASEIESEMKGYDGACDDGLESEMNCCDCGFAFVGSVHPCSPRGIGQEWALVECPSY